MATKRGRMMQSHEEANSCERRHRTGKGEEEKRIRMDGEILAWWKLCIKSIFEEVF